MIYTEEMQNHHLNLIDFDWFETFDNRDLNNEIPINPQLEEHGLLLPELEKQLRASFSLLL